MKEKEGEKEGEREGEEGEGLAACISSIISQGRPQCRHREAVIYGFSVLL